MATDFKISVTNIARKDGYRIFTLSVTNQSNQCEYKIYVSDNDIPFKDKESSLAPEALNNFAINEMRSWIEKSGGQLPRDKVMKLMNLGKIPLKDESDTKLKDIKVSDLVRTNVTIAAPLFEWAKSKAQMERTSFSDLVSRGLIKLKDSDKEVEAWFKEQGDYFRKKLGNYGSYEVFHYLPNSYSNFSTDTLKTALQAAELRRTGWSIGAYLTGGDQRPHPQEDGIKAEYTPTDYLLLDYWYAKNKGEFYFSRNLESDSGHGDAKPGTALYFDTLVWRVAESLEHCLAYYKNLNVNENERVKLRISLYGLTNRKLSAWNPARAFTLRHYTCGSDRSSWETEMTLRELKEQLDDVIYQVTKKLLVMFDFFVPNKEVVFDILQREYRKSNM